MGHPMTYGRSWPNWKMRTRSTGKSRMSKLEPKIEQPGKFPFTRGIHATMYRGKLWTMRQYAGFGTAKETNQRYRYLLGQGQTGLSMAFDLPTQIGYDSDDSMALGEVGRVGVAISSLADMDRVLPASPPTK